jgi:subtilisin family serine protease
LCDALKIELAEIFMFRRIVFLVLSALMLTAGFVSSGFAQGGQALDFKPGEVIVGYHSEADRRASERLFKNAPLVNSFSVLGGQKAQKLEVSPRQDTSLLLRFSLPPVNNAFADGDPASQRRLIDDLTNQIKKVDPRVKYVYPNYLLRVPEQKPNSLDNKRQKKLLSTASKTTSPASNGFPNDPLFASDQWDYQALPIGMNAIGAWKITTGDRRIVVAVIDTGILRSHPDVVGSGNLQPGYNFASDGAGRSDDASDPKSESHGSNVASVIGAVATNNKLGVAGINWSVSVLPVRVFNEEGGASFKDLADGILWAAGLPVEGAPTNKFPADVINLSVQLDLPCDQVVPLKDAIDRARSAGSVVVAAAGNGNKTIAKPPIDIAGVFPAGCAGVISVAASDSKGHLASYSNFGNVSIVAPGGDDNEGNARQVYGIGGTETLGWSGTSQAAPHVAGAIALAMAKHEEWRRHPDLIAAAIHDTAVPMQAGACSHPCGPGQLDAQRLIEYVPSPPKQPLTAAVSSPMRAPPKAAKISTASASNDVSGRWLMTQGSMLVIEGGEWFHPSKGTALISLVGQENMIVRYPQQIGVTCAYRVMLLENRGALYLEPTNASQPDEFCPSGRLASGSQAKPVTSSISPTAAASSTAETKGEAASNKILGRWLLNSGGILVIEQDQWLHPTKGAANIMLVGNDQFIVQYPQQTYVKCAYRVVLLDNGKALKLVPTNNLQPEEYCPTGQLTGLR